MTTTEHPEHIAKPHIRPVQAIPVKKDEQQFAALRDPLMLSQQTMVIPPPVLQVLRFFQGQMTVEEIAEKVNAPVEKIIELVEGLDNVGLLWGPNFEKLEADVREKIRQVGAFPATVSQSMGKDADECRAAMKGWFEEADDPEFEKAPTGVISTHLDYQRGWPNYAQSFYPLQSMPKPDRVVILGCNLFGLGDGVAVSEYDFITPLGRVKTDRKVTDHLTKEFGKSLTIDHLDFLPDQTIELQLPWLQYCWPDVPVVAALVPDPGRSAADDDHERVSNNRFIEGLKKALNEAGGTTFFICATNLSHVGPQFGEPRPVDEQRRFDVEKHDRELIGKFLDGNAEDFISAVNWTKNPTRWMGVGAMSTAIAVAEPESLELVDYRQAYDENGNQLVSTVSIAMF